MKEHMNKGVWEPYLVIRWSRSWYQIPIFVLEDILYEWHQTKVLSDKDQVMRLEKWISENGLWAPWDDTKVKEIKTIIKAEMSQMSAYKLYQLT